MASFLDCRNPIVRACAARLGRCVQIWRIILRPWKKAWALFGGANFLMNVMASTVVACCVLLIWWAVVEDIVPLSKEVITSVEPADRIIDREHDRRFVISRRICMDRAAWGKPTRMFITEGVGGIKHEVADGPLLFLAAGCHERVREVRIPDSLPPGHYIYRSHIEFCNRLRCEAVWLHDLPITLVGPWPIQPTGGSRPMMQE